MASMTTCGFCEVAALSRYTRGLPLTFRVSTGNCFLMVCTSRLFDMVAVSIMLCRFLSVERSVFQHTGEWASGLYFPGCLAQMLQAITIGLLLCSGPWSAGRTALLRRGCQRCIHGNTLHRLQKFPIGVSH